jgi:TATA-binding protein-associated factor Taf7
MMSGSSLRVCVLKKQGFPSTNHPVDARRAIFHIGNNLYSAKLVDLPCIIESQKTLDGKQMFKVADICQVLAIALHLVAQV